MSYSLPSRPCSPTSPSRTLLGDPDLSDASDPFKLLMFPAIAADSPSPLSTTSGNDSSSPTTTPSPTPSYDALAAQFLREPAEDNQFLTDFVNMPQDDETSTRKEDTHDIPRSLSSSQGLQMRVIGVPNTGAKSRVETQIKLCVQLLLHGEKVSTWSHLRLPEEMLARSKLKRTQQQKLLDGVTMVSDESRILTLEAKIMCASHPDKTVRMCVGCVRRERKRAERTKDGKRDSVSPSSSSTDLARLEDEALERERDRVLLFNCSPMLDFSAGDVILPTRITCYCRHHNERVGFRVHFLMRNAKGETVAAGLSPPIMITDDHKSAKQQQQQCSPQQQEPVPHRGNKRKRHLDGDIHTPDTPAPSRRGSVSSKDAEHQHHTSPLLTPIEELAPTFMLSDSLWMTPATISAPSTTTTMFPVSEEHPAEALQPAVPPHETSMMFPDLETPWPFDHRSQTLLGYPSESLSVFATDLAPQLDRLVPSRGPTYGGVEVTVLGSGFYRGLTCLFGENVAATVYWNPNTLVCVLPPAAQPGPVAVSFKEHPLVLDGGQNVALFTYFDSSEQALLELALQVVGLKMTGKLQDAKQVAMQIVQGGQDPTTVTQTQRNGSPCADGVEQPITEALQASSVADVLHTNPSGHTMLHLAAVLDYRDLAAMLIKRVPSESIDQQDRNGFTALHFACWRGSLPMVELLLAAGADPTMMGNLGTPAEVASLDSIRARLFSHRKPLSRRSSVRRFHTLDSQPDTAASDAALTMDDQGLGPMQPKLDRRLYLFWLPLLLVTIGLLYCQILGDNSALLALLQDSMPFQPRGLFAV